MILSDTQIQTHLLTLFELILQSNTLFVKRGRAPILDLMCAALGKIFLGFV